MRRRLLLRVDALAVLALLLVSALATNGSAADVSAAAVLPAQPVALTAPTSAHPFSDPVWFPLRTPAKVSCVRTNCASAGKDYHSYWAMDLLSPDNSIGDPVYAAGAGILHVGAVDNTCRSSVNDAGGTWVWIDHGAGKVSRYHHLNTVRAKEGQYVTPATVIGTMGHSGDIAPCKTNYLHFEVRIHGVKGDRVNPGTLKACVSGQAVSWPASFGKSSWDSLTARSVTTPASSSSCIPSTWTTTPARPTQVSGKRAWERVRISWPTPAAGVNRAVVAIETYHPSVPEWGAPVYRTLTASTTTQLYTGLQNGRRYRMRVSLHNASGNSAWSSYVYETAAGRPSVPKSPRWLTSTTTKIRYAWWKSAEHGTPTTSYTVAVRGKTSSGWKAWVYTTVSAKVLNHNWTSVSRGRTYQVRVRANSAVGSSEFSAARSIRVK